MSSARQTNASANRWSAVHQASSATPKYVPMHKRPSGPSSSSSSSTSSRSSDASSSRASSPTPSSISSMSSVASSPRTKYQPSKAPHHPTNTTQSPSHPLIYTPTHLFSMRPLALESVKERMRTACPEVTMNRRQRKGLEYAANQARKAARESGSGMSSSGSSMRGGSGSSVGASSVAGSDVGSPSPVHARAPSFDDAEASDEEEEVELLQPIASNVARPTPTRPTASSRRQGLPRDLPQDSWRALHRLGVPVSV